MKPKGRHVRRKRINVMMKKKKSRSFLVRWSNLTRAPKLIHVFKTPNLSALAPRLPDTGSAANAFLRSTKSANVQKKRLKEMGDNSKLSDGTLTGGRQEMGVWGGETFTNASSSLRLRLADNGIHVCQRSARPRDVGRASLHGEGALRASRVGPGESGPRGPRGELMSGNTGILVGPNWLNTGRLLKAGRGGEGSGTLQRGSFLFYCEKTEEKTPVQGVQQIHDTQELIQILQVGSLVAIRQV